MDGQDLVVLPPMADRCRAESTPSPGWPFTGEHSCRLRRDAPHEWHVCACGHVWPAPLT